MTWLLAGIIAAMVSLYSLGYLTACVVNAPLLREVPERPLLQLAETVREPGEVLVGWSPNGVCVECGEGRRPVVAKDDVVVRPNFDGKWQGDQSMPRTQQVVRMGNVEATITGYACACPLSDSPVRPSVVLDPFVGTGTVPMVARALGRFGIGIDLSADYLRLARWRITSGHAAKAVQRTHRENQGGLFANPARVRET